MRLSLSGLDAVTVCQENSLNMYYNLGSALFKVPQFCKALMSNSEHWTVSVSCNVQTNIEVTDTLGEKSGNDVHLN